MNNKLILYKENVFTKISNWFKNLFFKNKRDILSNDEKNDFYEEKEKSSFDERIIVGENLEEKRLKMLQMQYDNDEIDDEDISPEDTDKLIKMYERETEELNADTERRKKHIEEMLNELKKVN